MEFKNGFAQTVTVWNGWLWGSEHLINLLCGMANREHGRCDQTCHKKECNYRMDSYIKKNFFHGNNNGDNRRADMNRYFVFYFPNWRRVE